MGKDSVQDKIGLYGYKAGVNTFGLMENGTAFFGAKSGGGQIIIDGTSAKIYGGGNSSEEGGDASNGMTITLADLKADGSTEAIKIGGGAFTVKYNGTVKATNAEVSGTIYASSGKIGGTKTGSNGWTIETNRLYSGSGSTRVELNSQSPTNTSTPTNNNDFAIWAGSATASSAKFSVSKGGLITAKQGNIGGWILSSNKLTSDNYRTGIASSGTYRFWAGASSSSTADRPVFSGSSYFYVTSSGEMQCKNATINGSIYADDGEIGGWTISSNRISGGRTTLYSNGRIVCDDFESDNVDISGDINATTLTCDNGEIGGWIISESGLENGATRLYNGLVQTNQVDIFLDNRWRNKLGTLGYVEGEDDYGPTENIGILTGRGDHSIILKSSRNIALRTEGGGIWITGGSLNVNVSKENQHGIYAQFA